MSPPTPSPSQTARRWSASTAAPAYRPAGAIYRPRRPTETPLYPVVQHHLETFLAQAQDTDPLGWGVPSWVERDFRSYLRCGILAHGFARVRCTDCGHDRLLAFSCKGRGVCPSCNARRMAEVAVHLTDAVIPHLPVRQWVLSVPKRLRPFLHQTPEVASAVLGIFLRALRGDDPNNPRPDPVARASGANALGEPPRPAPARRRGSVSWADRLGSQLPGFNLSRILTARSARFIWDLREYRGLPAQSDFSPNRWTKAMTVRDVVRNGRLAGVLSVIVAGCQGEPHLPTTIFAVAVDSIGETLRIDLLTPLNDPGLTLEATTLEADWVIGGTRTSDSLVRFSRLADITPDGHGGLFAIDDRLREVLWVDSQGRLRNRFGREGDGPGEFRNPWVVERVDDRLLVLQGTPAATFQLFTIAGEGLASAPLPVPGDWVRPVNRHPHIDAPGRQHSPEDIARRLVALDRTHFMHRLETDESAKLLSTDGGTQPSEEPRFAYVIRYALDSQSGPRITVRDTLAVLPGTPVTAFDRIPGGPVLFEQPAFSPRPVIAAGGGWYAIGHGDRRELDIFASDGSLRTVLRFTDVRPTVDDESKRDIARWILAMRMANSEVSREIFHSTSRGDLGEWVEGTAFELTAFSERFPYVDRLLGAGDCLLLTTIEPRNTPDRGGWTFVLLDVDGDGVFGPFRIAGGGDEPMYFDRSGGWVAGFDGERVFVTQRDRLGEFSVGRYTLPGVRC